MKYDPVKRSLGNVFNKTAGLRRIFYRLLDLLLLRSWHIRKELRNLEKGGFIPSRIADAGSGFGQYTYYLSNRFPDAHITGLEIKEEQVEDCNRFFSSIHRENRVKFRFADLTRYREIDTYDLILCVDVMEHIEEDRAVFQNFHASLAKGGILLISTPSDQGGSDVYHDTDESFIEEHVRDGYGIEDITEKLSSAGFSSTLVKYSYGKPGNLSWKLSMKFPIIMINKSKLFLLVLPIYYLVTYPLCFILNYLDVLTRHKTGTGLIVISKK